MPLKKQHLQAFVLVVAVLLLAGPPVRGFEDSPNGLEFAGSGYNILIANPLNSKTQDPGIRKQIFNFTYTEGKFTPDGKWPIPDQIQAEVREYCEFQTNYKSYTGMQAYSNQVSSKINAGIAIPLGFKFSLGREYQENQANFKSERQVQWSIDGSCEAYSVTVDNFDVQPLRADFIQGLRKSFQSGDWDLFIDTYGTHFITQSVLGGRMSLLQNMKSQTYADFEAQKFNFQVGASASYKLITGFGSFSTSKEREDGYYFQSHSEQSSVYFLGPIPAPGSTASQWQAAVRDNPTSISYEIQPLYQLVTASNFPDLDQQSVKASMDAGLQAYCTKHNCTTPSNDPPLPPPAQVKIYQTGLYGNSGSGSYMADEVIDTPFTYICLVRLRCKSFIDGIQIGVCDKNGNQYILEQMGDLGSDPTEYNLPYDEDNYINGFTGTYYYSFAMTEIINFQFKTKRGQLIPPQGCGSQTGKNSFSGNTPGPIVGLYGYDSSKINRIGFYYSQLYYPQNQEVEDM